MVAHVRGAIDKPLLACPNSGEVWDFSAHDWQPAPASEMSLPEAALKLRAAGVNVLGGCCRVGPAEIRQLRKAIS